MHPGLDLLASRKGTRQPGWGIAEMVVACCHLSLTAEEQLSVQPVRRLDRVGLDLSSFEFKSVAQPLQPCTVVEAFPNECSPKGFTEAVFPTLPPWRQEVNNLWYISGSKVA